MMFLEPIKVFINKTDSKKFFNYIIGYLVVCVLLFTLGIFYYYKSISALQKKIKNINSLREEEVLAILETAVLVKQQRSMVEETLAKDVDFKIAGYFKNLLVKLAIKDKEVAEETSTIDLEENYRKSELNAKFENMTMKELTGLLQEIEQNSRIAANRIEITRSKKKPKTIDVSLTISTLLPKIEITST
ncbi:MAG TPA: hypothetical protein VLB80_01700 [Candidatus Babeliales bacterium]|nr:hypothetical protein [Candidatus Babeliales bacterium]